MNQPIYQTNFEMGQSGNILRYGKDLKIRVVGASILVGRLEQKDKNGNWNVIQIEQSGRKSNPWPDTVVFETLNYHGKRGQYTRFPSGTYRVFVMFWKDNRGGHFRDVFEIE